MIIVEGPDGSGKTTLVKQLSNQFDLTIAKWNKPPKTNEELRDNLALSKHMIKTKTIQDRIPWITDPIYSAVKKETSIKAGLKAYLFQIKKMNPILIYCRPPKLVIKNKAKEAKSPEDTDAYLFWLIKSIDRITELYDDFMWIAKPIFTYNWTSTESFFTLIEKINYREALTKVE